MEPTKAIMQTCDNCGKGVIIYRGFICRYFSYARIRINKIILNKKGFSSFEVKVRDNLFAIPSIPRSIRNLTQHLKIISGVIDNN